MILNHHITTDKSKAFFMVNNPELELKWAEISKPLNSAPIPLKFETVLENQKSPISINVDIDPGGGFEGGYELTSLTAAVPIQFTSLSAPINKDEEFTFSVHDEGLLDRVGKFFGMEDLITGDSEFDKNLIVKTNNLEKTKVIFSDPEIREVFQSLKYFSLQIENESKEAGGRTLEFLMDKAVTKPDELKKIVMAFTAILNQI